MLPMTRAERNLSASENNTVSQDDLRSYLYFDGKTTCAWAHEQRRWRTLGKECE